MCSSDLFFFKCSAAALGKAVELGRRRRRGGVLFFSFVRLDPSPFPSRMGNRPDEGAAGCPESTSALAGRGGAVWHGRWGSGGTGAGAWAGETEGRGACGPDASGAGAEDTGVGELEAAADGPAGPGRRDHVRRRPHVGRRRRAGARMRAEQLGKVSSRVSTCRRRVEAGPCTDWRGLGTEKLGGDRRRDEDGRAQPWRHPQGAAGAPGHFTRLMSIVLTGLERVQPFIDDIIVHSASVEQHMADLEQLFTRLSHHGIKLAPPKIHIGCRSVKFLGHVVEVAGVRPDADKVTALLNMPEPHDMTTLRLWLGLANNYRRSRAWPRS